jgi:hypothetical protein
MFESYKSGKVTLPKELYVRLIKEFKLQDQTFFNQKIYFLDSNWGRVKGGKNNYLSNRLNFDLGRKKAINFVVRRSEERFDVNMPLNYKLAYFIGLFIGDGFTNKYNSSFMVQFTGDKKEEEFYRGLFSDYSKKLFNISPRIKDDRVANAIRVNLYSKNLFKMITNRFKISSGRKSHTVLIPDEILNANESVLFSCVKGIYDAEGCLFFDRRKGYKKPYPRIDLHMCNLGILKQVHEILKVAGISSTLGTYEKNLRVTIYGEENIKKFIKKIGFNNPKQIKKLKEANLI